MKKSEVRQMIKEELSKQSINEDAQKANFVADMFARYLVSNRAAALVSLKRSIKDEFGAKEEVGSKEWDKQLENLTTGISAVIKKYMD